MTWHDSPYVWIEGDTRYISVVFSWQITYAMAQIRQQVFGVRKTIVGGPAVKISPHHFQSLPVEIGDDYPGMLQRYNPFATRTSRGCPNSCGFCAVKKIHPGFREIDVFPIRPIICDDNLLACSQKHFDRVIDKLKKLDWCDFNQGLDAMLLTQHHIDRFAELKAPIIRLAWDNVDEEAAIISAIRRLRKAGFPKRNLQCYVLIGYNDTPDDALYRLETLYHRCGIKPNPMRYQPPGCLKKNEHVALGWTNEGLKKFMYYWSRLRYTGKVPFDEYVHHKKSENENQLHIEP